MISRIAKFLLWKWMFVAAPFRKGPDFVIVGVQKGGTTSLYYYLNQHPQIRMARRKEIHFFTVLYQKGLTWYKSFFHSSKNGKILRGEASPEYFFHPSTPLRLKRHFPEAKIIVLLRDPIERALSHFYQNKKSGKENREPLSSFEEALKAELERVGKMNYTEPIREENLHYNEGVFSYLQKGDYVSQLTHWLKYFDRSHILVLKSEDLFQKPEGVLQECHRFLQVANVLPGDLEPQNVNDAVKNQGLSEEFAAYLKEYKQQQSKGLQELGYSISWD